VASIERTAYPRFKRYYTAHELEEIYTPTQVERTFARQATTGKDNYFTWIVLLKVFQRLGYFPQIADIPAAITLTHSLSSRSARRHRFEL
jgi:Domain of unknown function (DUF4158)